MRKLSLFILQRLAPIFPLCALLLHYFRGRSGGSRRSNITQALDNENESTKETLYAVWDFHAWPYALGDIINWNICVACEAMESGYKYVDVVVILDRTRPSSKAQRYITTSNYEKFVLDIIPAFFMQPLLQNIHVYQSRNDYERSLIRQTLEGTPTTLDMHQYAEQLSIAAAPDKYTFYTGEFKTINDFYRKHQTIPFLKPILGAELISSNLKFGFPQDVFFVALHLRQRGLESGTFGSAADLNRDVDFDPWINFLKKTAQTHPNVRFLIMGRHEEFDRRLFTLTNVVILKHHGVSLSGELTAILEADLFMGSNSGPAMVAMLSRTPYIIFQTKKGENITANICEIEVGDKQLQFAQPHQYIIWEQQETVNIKKHFDQMYLAINANKTR